MSLSFNEISKLIVKPQSQLIRIILDYGVIVQKLKNSESQSWYFIRGYKSNIDRLENLKKEYEEIRKQFNKLSLDDLICKLTENQANKDFFIGRNVNTILLMHISSLSSQIKYNKELIEIKRRVKHLKSIDFYIENSNEFLILSGWETT